MGFGHLLKSVGLRIPKSFSDLRDNAETGAVVAGNYLLPGSSLLTSQIASKGAQKQLSSPLGQVATIGSGLAGSGVGSSFTGIPDAASQGAGWTNAANSVGGAFGFPTVGTDASNSLSSLFGSGSSNAGSTPGIPGSSGSIGTGADGASSNITTNLKLPTSDLSSALSTGTGGGSSSYASGAGSSYDPAETSFLNNAKSSLTGATSGATGMASPSSSGSSIPILSALLGGANSMSANAKAQKDLINSQNQAIGQLNPYLASGNAANTKLSELLGTGGDSTSSDYGSLNTPFTADNLQDDPGYKFQLAQGNQALDRQQAARGNYFSGSALKAGQDYGQGLADTTLKDAFARNLATKQNTYNEYAGQSGQGVNAANAAGNIYTGIGNAKAGAGISSSNIFNSTLSSLLSGSGAKRPINVGGQIIYI